MDLISELIRLNSRVAAFSSSLDRRFTVEHIPTVAVSIIAKRIHEGINRNPLRVAGINSRESSRGASVGTDCPATCAFVCLLVSQYVFPALFKEYLLSVSLVITRLIGHLKSRATQYLEAKMEVRALATMLPGRPGRTPYRFYSFLHSRQSRLTVQGQLKSGRCEAAHLAGVVAVAARRAVRPTSSDWSRLCELGAKRMRLRTISTASPVHLLI
jgi:hypothetical protein